MLSGVWRKSSRSAQGNGGQCVQVRVVRVPWHKAQACHAGDCVQVRVMQEPGRAH